MPYLHLVHIAERKGVALTRPQFAGQSRSAATVHMPSSELHRFDDEGAFFTDGPYIETKEYLAGGLSEMRQRQRAAGNES